MWQDLRLVEESRDRFESTFQDRLGCGWRLVIAGSAAMLCITVCKPARIDRELDRRRNFTADMRSLAITPTPLPGSDGRPHGAGCYGFSASHQCSSGRATIAAWLLAWYAALSETDGSRETACRYGCRCRAYLKSVPVVLACSPRLQ